MVGVQQIQAAVLARGNDQVPVLIRENERRSNAVRTERLLYLEIPRAQSQQPVTALNIDRSIGAEHRTAQSRTSRRRSIETKYSSTGLAIKIDGPNRVGSAVALVTGRPRR